MKKKKIYSQVKFFIKNQFRQNTADAHNVKYKKKKIYLNNLKDTTTIEPSSVQCGTLRFFVLAYLSLL